MLCQGAGMSLSVGEKVVGQLHGRILESIHADDRRPGDGVSAVDAALIPLPDRFAPPGIYLRSSPSGSTAGGSSNIYTSGLRDLSDTYPEFGPRISMTAITECLVFQLGYPACTLLAK